MAVITKSPTPSSRSTTPRSARRRQRGTAALFMVPFFVVFIAVTIAPIFYAAWMSLFREQTSGLGFGGTERVFTGIENFTKALTDEKFLASFGNIAIYCVVYIPLMIGVSLGLALLVDSALARAKRFFQIAFYMPHAVPGMIAATIWLFLYAPGLSPIHQFLDGFGMSWNFFGEDEALLSMVNISAWQWIGYNMIIFYAGLQAIPTETIEAARVDGASAMRTALSIKIPMIRPTIMLTMLFTIVGAIQLFDAPQLLMSRANSLGAEWSPTMFIYSTAFLSHDYGLAAAASLLLALVAGVLSFGVTKLGNRWKDA